MAVVKEMTTSGEADVIGIAGEFRSRTFQVILRDAGDNISDPISPMNVGTGFGNPFVPLGSRHPENRELVAVRYSGVERMKDSPDVWVINVDYELPDIDEELWRISFRSGTETEEMRTDRDGKLVGTNAYRMAEHGETSTFRAKTIRSIVPVHLISRPGVFVEKTIPRFKRATTMTLARIVPKLTTSQVGALTNSQATVSESTFFGVPGDQILMAGFDAQPLTGENRIKWQVVINFLWSPEKWTPVTLFDRFEVDGFESNVFAGDPREVEFDAVSTTYKVYRKTNFTEMLQFVATGIRTIGPRP